MTNRELAVFLNEEVDKYNCLDFIPSDPISIPHIFSLKQDIEISALIAAVFAWGQRKTIISKSKEFLNLMDDAPYDFVVGHCDNDLKRFLSFSHRTFQPSDALYFIEFFSNYYKAHDSMEQLFLPGYSIENGIKNFHDQFFDYPDAPNRTRKHIPTPAKNSSCKRINMFLRWMVRQDTSGVDFGIWKQLSQANLICPLDLHVGNVARELGLIRRSKNDWAAAIELTKKLREIDPNDPVKYDFALFGLGVSRRLL